MMVNPLPDDKISGLPKLIAFADEKLNFILHIKVAFHRMENMVGIEENAGYLWGRPLILPIVLKGFIF